MAEEDFVAVGFCSNCRGESTDETPGNVSTTNGIGRKFYGSADPCAVCGSVVRTLWWTFIDVPIVPRGSYRYKTISDDEIRMSRFWARRTRTHWDQIIKTWVVGFAIAVAVVVAIVIYKGR